MVGIARRLEGSSGNLVKTSDFNHLPPQNMRSFPLWWGMVGPSCKSETSILCVHRWTPNPKNVNETIRTIYLMSLDFNHLRPTSRPVTPGRHDFGPSPSDHGIGHMDRHAGPRPRANGENRSGRDSSFRKSWRNRFTSREPKMPKERSSDLEEPFRFFTSDLLKEDMLFTTNWSTGLTEMNVFGSEMTPLGRN